MSEPAPRPGAVRRETGSAPGRARNIPGTGRAPASGAAALGEGAGAEGCASRRTSSLCRVLAPMGTSRAAAASIVNGAGRRKRLGASGSRRKAELAAVRVVARKRDHASRRVIRLSFDGEGPGGAEPAWLDVPTGTSLCRRRADFPLATHYRPRLPISEHTWVTRKASAPSDETLRCRRRTTTGVPEVPVTPPGEQVVLPHV